MADLWKRMVFGQEGKFKPISRVCDLYFVKAQKNTLFLCFSHMVLNKKVGSRYDAYTADLLKKRTVVCGEK